MHPRRLRRLCADDAHGNVFWTLGTKAALMRTHPLHVQQDLRESSSGRLLLPVGFAVHTPDPHTLLVALLAETPHVASARRVRCMSALAYRRAPAQANFVSGPRSLLE